MERLEEIAKMLDQKEKVAAYREALQSAMTAQNQADCSAILDHILADDVPVVVSRTVMQDFAKTLPQLQAEIGKPLAKLALEKMATVNFEETIASVREHLARLLEASEEFSAAAHVLSAIDLDSGMRVVDTAYKLGLHIKVAMLFLEDDDAVGGEAAIKRAGVLMTGCKDEALELQYKTCYARIMDSKRQFLQAALRYYDLSQLGERLIGGQQLQGEDLLEALKSAVTCAILAPAGPQRSSLLASLCKDERSKQLLGYPVLEKMFLERILQKEEVDAFTSLLKEHQRAMDAEGVTVLQKAVVQHNLLSASKLYRNISIDELGALLGVPPRQAERVAADMIGEGRLEGSIDQVEEFINFADKEEPMLQWDGVIRNVCNDVNEIVRLATAKGVMQA